MTRELVLPVETGVLDDVDLIDIPAFTTDETPLLTQAKRQWLLDHYRQQLQPDVWLSATRRPDTIRRPIRPTCC